MIAGGKRFTALNAIKKLGGVWAFRRFVGPRIPELGFEVVEYADTNPLVEFVVKDPCRHLGGLDDAPFVRLDMDRITNALSFGFVGLKERAHREDLPPDAAAFRRF